MSNLIETKSYLESYSNLPIGWNFGRGIPIKDDIKALAHRILDFAAELGLKVFEVFPGDNGEVQISFYHYEQSRLSYYFEMIIDAEDDIMFCCERIKNLEELGYEVVTQLDNLSLSQSLSLLEQIYKNIPDENCIIGGIEPPEGHLKISILDGMDMPQNEKDLHILRLCSIHPNILPDLLFKLVSEYKDKDDLIEFLNNKLNIKPLVKKNVD